MIQLSYIASPNVHSKEMKCFLFFFGAPSPDNFHALCIHFVHVKVIITLDLGPQNKSNYGRWEKPYLKKKSNR